MTNHQPYSFYKLLPDGRFEFHVDASLLKSFSLCEEYFHLKHVKNLRTKSLPGVKPFAMAIGSWWSDVMEEFYSYMRSNIKIDLDKIQEIALTCWAKNNLDECSQAEPDKFKDFGELPGAVLMLKEYHDSQYTTDLLNWKVVGVEEGFGLKNEVPLGETRSSVVYWIGKPDLVVVENNRLTPVDHKTVSRIDGFTISRYKPSSQMPGYVHSCEVIARSLGYAVNVDRCVVNICARSKPSDTPRKGNTKRPRFIRAYPNFTKEEIAEWRRQVVLKCDRIAHCLRTGDWTWSETSCHNMYMRSCEFLKLHSITPLARDSVLNAGFITGEPWRPYKVLED
jgi:hypothetical protein